MKNEKDIAILKEKYWRGETTLAEEQLLKDICKDLSQESPLETVYFAYLQQEKAQTYTKIINMPQAEAKRSWITSSYTKIVAIAASLALVVVVYSTWESTAPSSNEIVIDDPELALQITKETLALLSGQVAKGEEAVLGNMEHLEKTFIFK